MDDTFYYNSWGNYIKYKIKKRKSQTTIEDNISVKRQKLNNKN